MMMMMMMIPYGVWNIFSRQEFSSQARGYDVNANNCMLIIVSLQIMVCSCAVQNISNNNDSAFFFELSESTRLLERKIIVKQRRQLDLLVVYFGNILEGAKYWQITL